MSMAQGLRLPASTGVAHPAGFSPGARDRFQRDGSTLEALLRGLYGQRADFASWFEGFIRDLAAVESQRAQDLRRLDEQRLAQPDWLVCNAPMVYSCYVDRFGATLAGIEERIPYLRELGIGMLHLLPFLKMRPEANDGGFAVSDFGVVDPALGSNADLARLTQVLRSNGISLMADIVLNHVADDHPWACAARAGDAEKAAYFLGFESAEAVARIESDLEQVFPDQAPGNFTWSEALKRWVWTTFYDYQWDLNYQNPQVFGEMALAMIRLANLGVEVFRVDSAPYMWKRPGTDCRNQPEVHTILQGLRLVLGIVSPAAAMNAEAIVDRAEIQNYFGIAAGVPECTLAYNAGLMASIWLALGNGDVGVLRNVIRSTPELPPDCAWVNYLRCHDDIIWGVLRQDVQGSGRSFEVDVGSAVAALHGAGTTSWARGTPSQQHDALHGTSGMTSALVGLALEDEASLRRFALAYCVVFAMPGLPLVYMGDELGQANAVLPADVPELDTRWLHRPYFDVAAARLRHVPGTLPQRMFALLRWLDSMRRRLRQGGQTDTVEVLSGPSDGVLILQRGQWRILANFSGQVQRLALSDGAWEAYLPWQEQPGEVRTAVELPAFGQAWLQHREPT